MHSEHYTVNFPTGRVDYCNGAWQALLKEKAAGRKAIIITDARIFSLYSSALKDYPVIIIEEGVKDLTVLTTVIDQLILLEADRQTIIIGFGGGTVTDVTGFVGSIYMRGVGFAFVPSTLLGMVDAAIGGKNGVDFGRYKNMIGIVRQPQFIIYDVSLLNTLPGIEWSNGFAEIIKYACIFDKPLLELLEERSIDFYMSTTKVADLIALVQHCVAWKNKTVAADETERGLRKLLNFGHTAGHAIEKVTEVAHGKAVAIGMLIATRISEVETGLDPGIYKKLELLLEQYELPTYIDFGVDAVMDLLQMDKKKHGSGIDYILLEGAGKGTIKNIPLDVIRRAVIAFRNDRKR